MCISIFLCICGELCFPYRSFVVTLHGLRLKMHTRPGLKRKKPFRLHLGCTASKPKSWTFFVPLWCQNLWWLPGKVYHPLRHDHVCHESAFQGAEASLRYFFCLGPSHHDLRSCCKPLLGSHCMRQSQHLLLHAGRSGQDIGLCSWTPSVMTCLATLLQWASLGDACSLLGCWRTSALDSIGDLTANMITFLVWSGVDCMTSDAMTACMTFCHGVRGRTSLHYTLLEFGPGDRSDRSIRNPTEGTTCTVDNVRSNLNEPKRS